MDSSSARHNGPRGDQEPETARIQGVDLYREQAPRIVACMEYAAALVNQAPTDPMTGKVISYKTPLTQDVTVPGVDPTICPNKTGVSTVKLLGSGAAGALVKDFVPQPTGEFGSKAFANRRLLPMPERPKLLKTRRAPPAGWVAATHHIGWETLPHGALGGVGLPATTCGP